MISLDFSDFKQRRPVAGGTLTFLYFLEKVIKTSLYR